MIRPPKFLPPAWASLETPALPPDSSLKRPERPASREIQRKKNGGWMWDSDWWIDSRIQVKIHNKKSWRDILNDLKNTPNALLVHNTKSSSYHPAQHSIFWQTFSKKLHGKTVHSRRFNHQSISGAVDATGRAPDAPTCQTFLAELRFPTLHRTSDSENLGSKQPGCVEGH